MVRKFVVHGIKEIWEQFLYLTLVMRLVYTFFTLRFYSMIWILMWNSIF